MHGTGQRKPAIETHIKSDLVRDGRGRHRFHAGKPNGLWIADVAEFRIPAGKACLSPIVDCSGSMPPSWPISTSPDAGMAGPSLLGACGWLSEGTIPRCTRIEVAIAAGRAG